MDAGDVAADPTEPGEGDVAVVIWAVEGGLLRGVRAEGLRFLEAMPTIDMVLEAVALLEHLWAEMAGEYCLMLEIKEVGPEGEDIQEVGVWLAARTCEGGVLGGADVVQEVVGHGLRRRVRVPDAKGRYVLWPGAEVAGMAGERMETPQEVSGSLDDGAGDRLRPVAVEPVLDSLLAGPRLPAARDLSRNRGTGVGQGLRRWAGEDCRGFGPAVPGGELLEVAGIV